MLFITSNTFWSLIVIPVGVVFVVMHTHWGPGQFCFVILIGGSFVVLLIGGLFCLLSYHLWKHFCSLSYSLDLTCRLSH